MVFSDYVCEPTSGDRRKPVTGFVGDDRCGETPVPISNTVVKPVPPMILPSGKVGHCRLFDPAQGNLGRVAFCPEKANAGSRGFRGAIPLSSGKGAYPSDDVHGAVPVRPRLSTRRCLSTLRRRGSSHEGCSRPQPGMRSVSLTKIYVGNIAYETRENEIRELFTPYGTIEDLAMAEDKESGKFRGFAIVMIPDKGEAEKAISGLDGHRLRGRRLVVNLAVKKKKRNAESDDEPRAATAGTGAGAAMPRRVRARSGGRARRAGRNPRRG